MPEQLYCEQLSFEVVKAVEIEVDMRHNLNIHSRQIECRELTEIHSMVNIAACINMCYTKLNNIT